MELRIANEQEQLYADRQSSQIGGQTGYIGQLTGRYSEVLATLCGEWREFWKDRDTPEFEADFKEAINFLNYGRRMSCADESILETLKAANPQCAFGSDGKNFALRLDSEKYSYLINAYPDMEHADIHAYNKELLDRHMADAEHGIRFIDSNYHEKFRMPDGGRVRLTYDNGEISNQTCRYVDDTHLELMGSYGNLYHICELAEKMERNGTTIEPVSPTMEQLAAQKQAEQAAAPKEPEAAKSQKVKPMEQTMC